ncbi:hypothetical protein D5S18_28680 [Nocardia panacis]|uniref:Uncharacterized protein n=1 Tax=Nocardia panacis TaxID=2340916 RepID=A0A3A4K1W5_9NOCA|nr:hypothetical protein [Nocardia panacis]RJO70137.1 hypothetical protein D5S18_28680 [Nocardia panacis]
MNETAIDSEDIAGELARCRTMPRGRGRIESLEALAEVAGLEPRSAAEVLLALVEAYTFGGGGNSGLAAYTRLLRIHDEYELGSMSDAIHWSLKWLAIGLIDDPTVSLTTVRHWLDQIESRYRDRGYSPRPVLALRARLARELGDAGATRALLDAATAAPRDRMADCLACEHSEWGTGSAIFGADALALAQWRPVLDGDFDCLHEPHRVYARALIPLVRTGDAVAARRAHLVGYPLVRRDSGLRSAVGEHIEFCVLSGNPARGMEILAAHVDWLGDRGFGAADRLGFITGVCVLLRQVDAQGRGGLPVGVSTVESLLAELDSEIARLCAAADARNGNGAVSGRVARRLARRPLDQRIPLGLHGGFPSRGAESDIEHDPAAVAAAHRMADLGAALLADSPDAAEDQLRQALSVGAQVLPAEHTARLSAQLVSAISSRPGREGRLAEAALQAAARWEDISAADAVHHTLIAARALHRVSAHGEAAALFEQALAEPDIPYPDSELAVVRGEFGDSLRALDRHREAVEQFVLAFGLVRAEPARIRLRAELAWSAAAALDACEQDRRALAAYLHAAKLFGRAGLRVRRARCLRSAAWMQRWLVEQGAAPSTVRGRTGSPDSAERPWLDTMAAALAALAEPEDAAAAAELALTREQLGRMRELDGLAPPTV